MQILDLKYYEREKKIGKGQFNKVYESVQVKTNQFYAVKTLPRKKNISRETLIDFCQGLRIASQLNHPSIIQFIGWSPTNFVGDNYPVFITEFALNGKMSDLFTNSEEEEEEEEEEDRLCYFDDTRKIINIYGIASAMSYLHSNNILHRDLTTDNIFLDDHFYPKLSGFNISKEIVDDVYIENSYIKGTPAYISPETYLKREYTKKSDVYSFAFLIYEILTFEKPFQNFQNNFNSIQSLIQNGKRPQIPNSIPKCYQELIQRCWSEYPEERPTFDEIVQNLKTNPEFITEKVDKDEFYEYIKMIEHSEITFNSNKKMDQLDDFIKSNNRNFKDDMNEIIDLQNITPPDINKVFDRIKKEIGSSRPENIFDIYCIEDEEIDIEYKVRISMLETRELLKHDIINLYREVHIISRLNHPAIVKFLEYSPTDFRNKQKPVIIFGKSIVEHRLSSILKEKREGKSFLNNFDDTKKLINIYGIASAIGYLHSHNIIHRDIKADNIFLDDNLYPKLGGFNISKEIKNEQDMKSYNLKGTPAYLSPETYLKHEYNYKSDVYSYSLLIYEIMTNEKAFPEITNPYEMKELLCERKYRPNIPISIPKCYQELIQRCWSEYPEERPTFDEILQNLKTNPEFITETVDKEYFFEYVKYIDEYNATFEPNQRFPQLDDIYETKLHLVNDFFIDTNYKSLYETEYNNISFKSDIINLNLFNGLEFIDQFNFFSYYYTFDKKTNTKYKVIELSPELRTFYKHEFKNFSREMNIVYQLNHPSIIKYIGFSPINFYDDKYPIFITEFVSNGKLGDLLKNTIEENDEKINNFDDTKKLINIYGIASAIGYLHSHNIIHRDIKADNIFLDDNLYPKLGGFNISKEIKNEQDMKSYNLKGTPAYLSPETYLKREYTKKSDVYSYSYLIYEIMTNEKAFPEITNPYEMKKLLCERKYRPNIPISIPKCYQELIQRCWSEYPEERPTFDEILQNLKTNPEFITEKVDKDEFYEYIKMIEHSEITFNSNKKMDQIDKFIERHIKLYPTYEYNLNFVGIYDTETRNIELDFKHFNLENFVKKKKIYDEELCKHYEIIDTKTNQSYYAKVYVLVADEIESYEQIAPFVSREINVISQVNYPSIIKYVGFSSVDFKKRSRPVIITEYPPNGTLAHLLESLKDNSSFPGWNDTKKLINTYGIASAMAYLHSYNIVYCELNPINIYLDEYLFPKLTEFSFARKILNNSKISISSVNNYYSPPEVYETYEWKKNSDVFSFSLIVYEIWTNQKIKYSDDLEFLLHENKRPEFNSPIPSCYKELIEKCWSQDPDARPTFEEIVYQLRNDSSFITKTINKDEFLDYVNFINGTNQNHSFQKVNIDFTKNKNSKTLEISINMESIDLGQFDKQEKIGKGGFGVVYKVINKETNEISAAKTSIYEIDQCSENIIMDLAREVDIISRLNYPSVLRFIGYNPNNFRSKPKPTIITEYASNGSLDKIIELERNGMAIYEWDDTKKLINLYGIAMGMHYLHSHGIIHRDLKPANIFVDDYLYPKIGDFGLSKEKTNNNNKNSEKSSGFKGTFAYCAPEVLRKCIYSEKSDVYAYGMIAYEIITSSLIFEGKNQFQLMSLLLDGYRPEFKQIIPYCYRKLIEKCWSDDPEQRPDFASIARSLEYNKDFINDNIDKEEYLNYIALLNESDEYKKKSFIEDGYHQKQAINTEITNVNKILLDSTKSTNIYEISNEFQNFEGTFLDLRKYEKEDIVYKGDFSKVYKIKNKETGLIYAAKISMLNINKFTRDQVINLSREVNIISQITHPSFLKFIGYSPTDFKNKQNPVIVTEFSTNGNLHQILEMERKKFFFSGWDNTKKLINIYGIASGMSFLHSYNIIHRDLKPQNIFLDDYLFPKIGDFGLSTKFHTIDSLTYQSLSGLKGTPAYSSPEVLQTNEYSKSSDVYAFGMIVYEIITNEIPYQNLNSMNQIFSEVVIKENRPEINKMVPECYKNLIKKAWSQDPNERPSFSEIEYLLKTDPNFITIGVNKDEYHKYIQLIEDSKTSYNQKQKILQLNDLIDSKSRIHEVENPTLINEMDEFESIESTNENESEIISKYISSNNPKKLMEFLNKNCDNERILSIFDKLYFENQNIYFDLCKEGVSLNNAVAHHKYALLLIHGKEKSISMYKNAIFHLKESIKQEFLLSYFILARLMHEVFNDNAKAFEFAQKGAEKGECNSICLFGHFIANGIGMSKDIIKGVSIMLKSGETKYYERYATEIGIYYTKLKELQNKKEIGNDDKIPVDENFDQKAFQWFEKAYNLNKSNATINNIGVCYLQGYGVQKDIEKAKEIFFEGVKLGYLHSFYHIGFILEPTNQKESFQYYKHAADNGHLYSQNICLLKIDELPSICHDEFYKKSADDGNLDAKKFLAKKYSIENDSENTFKYISGLIEKGEFMIPLEYAINLYKSKQFKQAYNYFSVLSKFNHPIAKYFIGVMTFNGEGVEKDKKAAFKLLKNLAEKGINKASEFIEDNF